MAWAEGLEKGSCQGLIVGMGVGWGGVGEAGVRASQLGHPCTWSQLAAGLGEEPSFPLTPDSPGPQAAFLIEQLQSWFGFILLCLK